MITVTRKIEFCSGHRVAGHETKCQHLHGHNYTAYVTCTADELDELGRVIDFGVIKERLKGWIDAEWDHKFLMWGEDPLYPYLYDVHRESLVRLPFNPTAENMALHLRYVANDLFLDTPVTCIAVKLWETPNCYAEALT